MPEFNYQMTRVCSRAGREYYHIYPYQSIGKLPEKFGNLKIKHYCARYCVISFSDCEVIVFPSGRMLIENLPTDSSDRARHIVQEIIACWRRNKSKLQ